MAGVQNQEKKKRKRKKLDGPNTRKKKPIVVEKSLAHLNADEFMASIGQEDDLEKKELKATKDKRKKKKVKTTKTESKNETAEGNTSNDEVTEDKESNVPENIPKSSNVKEGLCRLEEKDSDFFKFLQENDPDLLNFDGGGDASDNSSDESSNDEASDAEKAEQNIPDEPADEEGNSETEDMIFEEPTPAEIPSSLTSTPVTSALLKKWEDSLDQKKSIPTWKQLVKAFHAAVVTAKGDEVDVDMKYSITDPDTVNKVMMLCLERSTDLLVHHLGDTPTASPKWGNVKMSLKSYLSNLTELLGNISSYDLSHANCFEMFRCI